MCKPIIEQALIYHLTSLSNIKSILQNGLKSRSTLTEKFKDVAEQDIVKFRNENKISNHISFHFFASSPFAGRVQKDHPKEEFIYITIHRNTAKRLKFKIIPTHPMHMNPLKIYDYNEGFEKIDWKTMELRDYSDSECKETCMAECVGHYKAIDSKAFHSIIVKSKKTEQSIELLCKELYDKECKKNFFIDITPSIFVRT